MNPESQFPNNAQNKSCINLHGIETKINAAKFIFAKPADIVNILKGSGETAAIPTAYTPYFSNNRSALLWRKLVPEI